MAPGNVGSWFVGGALTARPSSSHRYVGGLVYGAQKVNATDPFALAAIPGFLVIGQDRAFQFVVMGPCLAAASTVAVYWWYRSAKGGRGPTAGGAGSGR